MSGPDTNLSTAETTSPNAAPGAAQTEEPVADQPNSKSENGVSFEYGAGLGNPTFVLAEGAMSMMMASEVPIQVVANTSENDKAKSVNWAVGDGETWIYMEPDFVKDTGIARYRLSQIDGFIFKWMLEISNVHGSGFKFWDQSPDAYGIDTLVNGDHYVKYNSEHPNITMVQYW